MGFKKFVKKIAKPVAKIAAAPITVPLGIINKAGLSDDIKKITSVDTKNLENVINNSTSFQGSTGSAEFKNAFFDAAKIGTAAAGGAGALTATQAGGAFLVASKAQAGGGVTVGDLAAVGGYDTSFGGIDIGGKSIVKPKQRQSLMDTFSGFPNSIDEVYQEAVSPKNRNMVYMAGGVFALIAIIFIARKIRK